MVQGKQHGPSLDLELCVYENSRWDLCLLCSLNWGQLNSPDPWLWELSAPHSGVLVLGQDLPICRSFARNKAGQRSQKVVQAWITLRLQNIIAIFHRDLHNVWCIFIF